MVQTVGLRHSDACKINKSSEYSDVAHSRLKPLRRAALPFSEQAPLACKHSWLLWFWLGWLALWRHSFPRSPLHTPRQTTLYLLVFLCDRWCLSLLSGLFLPVFYIFHPSLVVKLAHLGVQTRARRNTMIRRPYLSVFRLRNVSVFAVCVAGTAYSCSKY
jgi:hypothetical protein